MCTQLTDLDIRGVNNLSMTAFTQIAQHLRGLREFGFSEGGVSTHGTFEILRLFGHQFLFSGKINLRLCGITSICMTALDRDFPRLNRRQIVCNFSQVSSLQMTAPLTTDSTHFLVHHGGHLRTLALKGNNDRLSDGVLSEIGNHCSRLTDIDISHSSEVTDDGVCALIHYNRDLTKINLSGCANITT
eukprot:gene28177-34993_t